MAIPQTPARDPEEKDVQKEQDPLFRDETGGEQQFEETKPVEQPTPTPQHQSREPVERKTRRRRSNKLNEKVTVRVWHKTETGKLTTRKKTITKKSLKTKYGKAGKKNDEQVYAPKRAVETKSGKIVKRGIKDESLYVAQTWKEGKPLLRVKGKEKEIVQIQTPTGERLETRERLKAIYKESETTPGKVERREGPPVKPIKKPRQRIPIKEIQVTATVMFKGDDGETTWITRWSNVQGREGNKFTLEEMEAQAVNRAISTYCSSTGLSSERARELIVDANYDYGKYL